MQWRTHRRISGASGEWLKGKPKRTIIWDGATVHRARLSQDKAKELGIEIIPLARVLKNRSRCN